MGVSQLSVSMGSWIVQLLFCFLIVSFGILGPQLKWVVFSWEASWGKVLTLDYLKRRGRVLANRCFHCEEEEESIDPLFIAQRLKRCGIFS